LGPTGRRMLLGPTGFGLVLARNASVSRASVSDISAGGGNSSVTGMSACSLPAAQAGFGVTIQVGGIRRGGGTIAAITVTTTKERSAIQFSRQNAEGSRLARHRRGPSSLHGIAIPFDCERWPFRSQLRRCAKRRLGKGTGGCRFLVSRLPAGR
jgi:hypothetical protein